MKRIALAVAVVVMAAGACKKAQNSNVAADSSSMRMADSMTMAPGDTTHIMADTSKAHMEAPTPPPAAAPAKPKATTRRRP